MKYALVLAFVALLVVYGVVEADELPEITNSIGIRMKLIPAGTFRMGGVVGELPHQVTLTKPFYLGVHEVTNAQWKAVMDSVPSTRKDVDGPVEQVSWEDAVDFCRKLSEHPQEKREGRVYRLPTEAEWEWACRAGTTTSYSFGDDESVLSDYGWFTGNSGDQTHPVGKKKPNPWGLYDMYGNVWEWCSDWHDFYPVGAATDPQGPAESTERVLRGGACVSRAGYCQSAYRRRDDPSLRNLDVGFRLALSSSGIKPPEAGK